MMRFPAVRLMLLSACGALVLAGLPGLASAATTRASDLTLAEDGATVTTSNGQSWVLTVADSDTTNSLGVGLTRTVTSGGTGFEAHLWNFDSSASTLTFNASTGIGTVKGGSVTSPVATIDLTFTATSHKAADCTSGSETIYSGTLTGEAKLVTGLTGGGTVGGTSLKFDATGSTPQIQVDNGCVAPPTDECTNDIIYASGATETTPVSSGDFGPLDGKAYDEVGVERMTDLAKPAGATRGDLAGVTTPAATWNASTHTLSVTTTSAGIVTGSATLTGGKPSTTTSTCTYAGKKYKISSTLDETATYASPSGKAITAHDSLGGNLVVANDTGHAFYDVGTAKAE
jgi:hypothetical protein